MSLITIVIPTRNEEGNIERVRDELLEALAPLGHTFEFVVVDNRSEDATPDIVRKFCAEDPRWRLVRFSRNFDVEASIAAGYRVARGEAIVVLYSDLQDPPSVIPAMIAKWEEGYDVVYGVRRRRPGDPRWRTFLIGRAYALINRLSDPPIPRDTGDFRLISRRVRDELERLGEGNRYTRGLISWLGFRQTGVEYERKPRLAGKSKAPLGHAIVFTFNAITSFSLKPLRLFTIMGFTVLLLTAAFVPVYLVLFFTGNPPPGITTVILLLLGAIGLNSLGIGVLGEYLGRTYAEAKGRPLYIVDETVNVDAGQEHRLRS